MSSRGRSKSLAVFAAVAAVGVVTACLMIRNGVAHERTAFVGNVDPKSGYRCRFTISSDWERNVAASRLEAASGIQFDVFHLTRSPTRQWIESALLHRPPVNAPTIALVAMDMVQNKSTVSYRIVEGYPELTMKGKSRIVAHRHLHVDGCPATCFE